MPTSFLPPPALRGRVGAGVFVAPSATITHSLATIKSHREKHAPPGLIEEICRQAGHRWRERTLGPAVTVHLFLLQLLAKVALSGLRHVSGLAVSAQAICKAKARL